MNVVRKPINKAVVDTSVLFPALTLEYARRSPMKRESILSRNKLPDYLRDSLSRQQAFLQFFDSLRTILITSHVIAELQGLQRLEGELLKEFWLCGMDWLKRKNVDERLLRLCDMYDRPDLRESVCVIGPADTGLIELARQEGYVLLTDDERTLARRAWDRNVVCELVKPLIVYE